MTLDQKIQNATAESKLERELYLVLNQQPEGHFLNSLLANSDQAVP